VQQLEHETFYLVAGTIIPVYFLALTLQGTFYDKIQAYYEAQAKRSLEAWQKAFGNHETANRELKKKYLRARPHAFIIGLAFIIATLVIILSAAGEALALLALYNGYAYQYANVTIWSAILALTIGTGLLILTRVFLPMATFSFRVAALFWRKAHNALSEEDQAPGGSPQAAAGLLPSARAPDTAPAPTTGLTHTLPTETFAISQSPRLANQSPHRTISAYFPFHLRSAKLTHWRSRGTRWARALRQGRPASPRDRRKSGDTQ
jgi:hypothetical protein